MYSDAVKQGIPYAAANAPQPQIEDDKPFMVRWIDSNQFYKEEIIANMNRLEDTVFAMLGTGPEPSKDPSVTTQPGIPGYLQEDLNFKNKLNERLLYLNRCLKSFV